MPIGKPTKGEREAAGDFVLSVFQRVAAQWPSICHDVQFFDPKFESLRDDEAALYEFTLAVIAQEMHAIAYLPSDQANRIRSHVLECLTTGGIGDYPRQAVAEYDEAWKRAISQENIPMFSVAAVLYYKLGLSSHVTFDRDNFLVISAVVDAIVRLGGPWWKTYIERYRIVA